MKKKELETLLKLINGEIDFMEGFSELIPNIEEFLQNNEQSISSERDLIYLLCEEVSKKFEKDDLSKFKMNKYFAYGLIKEYISSENHLLQQDEVFELLQSIDSIEMIDKILNDETLNIDSELRNNMIVYRDKLVTHSVYDKNGNQIGAIRFSDDEIKAIKAYIGEDVGFSFYHENDCTYMILNAFLKAGKTLGETSAGWKHNKSIIAILENPEEFMNFALNLSDALHKYGKTIKEPIRVIRSEPNAKSILESEKTISFFSTTHGNEELDRFKRDCKDSIITSVKNGVDSIDIADVLKGDYSKPEEKEILISPFIPFKYKTLNTKEHKFEDQVVNYEKTVGIYELEFQSGAISSPLSEEEKEDYQENMKVFLDPNLRNECIEIWKNLYGSNKEAYFKWREAFSTVFSYRQRERALVIDKEMQSNMKQSKTTQSILHSAIETTCKKTRTSQINDQVRQIREQQLSRDNQQTEIANGDGDFWQL